MKLAAILASHIATLLTTIFIASCAANSPANDSKDSENTLLKAAGTMQQRATSAYAAGNYAAALGGFEGAAQIYESLAMIEPAALARLSAARVMAEDSAQGLPQALQTVRRVLADVAELSPHTRITAHGRLAALLLAQPSEADLSGIAQNLLTAQNLCANSCPQKSALQVLQARLQLAQNNPSAAIVSASAALTDAADPSEQANALRTRAQAHARLSQHRQTIADATTALSLDRTAGHAARVIADLQLLATAHQALGETEPAQRYAALAERASLALQAVQRGLP